MYTLKKNLITNILCVGNILDEPNMNIDVESLSPEVLHPGTKIAARILEPITEKYFPKTKILSKDVYDKVHRNLHYNKLH